MQFDEVVVVKSRTGKDEEFRYDGAPVTIPLKKGIKVSRDVAQLAVEFNALRWDSSTGQVVDSKVYIEDDVDSPLETPHDALTQEDIAEVKATDGLGEDTIIVEGKLVKKKKINLKPTKAEINDSK